jgi:hypothetical protein
MKAWGLRHQECLGTAPLEEFRAGRVDWLMGLFCQLRSCASPPEPLFVRSTSSDLSGVRRITMCRHLRFGFSMCLRYSIRRLITMTLGALRESRLSRGDDLSASRLPGAPASSTVLLALIRLIIKLSFRAFSDQSYQLNHPGFPTRGSQ